MLKGFLVVAGLTFLLAQLFLLPVVTLSPAALGAIDYLTTVLSYLNLFVDVTQLYIMLNILFVFELSMAGLVLAMWLTKSQTHSK